MTPIYTAAAIQQRVTALGLEIERVLSPEERPVAVVVLQGAFVFAADLVRTLPEALGLEIAFLRCESYGTQTQSSGRVVLLQDLDATLDLHNRTVLLIDDILDTGLTLRFLVEHLQRRGAGRVLPCVLMRRQRRSTTQGVEAAFVGFEVDDSFFVGYGLDFAGKYRHLPNLSALPAQTQFEGDS